MVEKSPYMMCALLGSLMLMMTASLVFHMPKNGVSSGVMSNVFAMNVSGKNIGGEINNTQHSPSLSAEKRR